MRNISDKAKKWITVTGCLAVCAVMVMLIGSQLKTEKPMDADIDKTSQEKEVVVPVPELSDEEKQDDSGAVSTGTEQTIQGDQKKPQYTEEKLKDPTKTPDGKKVTNPPQPVDHDKVEPPVNPPAPSNPSGGLPGFDNVPNAGANQGEKLDDMYENGNKIGEMD